MEFFDTEEFSLFDLVDECQPYEKISPEAMLLLSHSRFKVHIDPYDDYTQGSTIDHDYD